jgi:hypothetical protein
MEKEAVAGAANYGEGLQAIRTFPYWAFQRKSGMWVL